MLEINGVELEFDLFDVEMADAYETAYTEAQKTLANIQKTDKLSEALRNGCTSVKKVFDTMFGSGTGEEVCGPRDNFKVCLEAFQALTDEVIRQRKELDEMNKASMTKYQGNRAARRANKK